MMRLLIVGAGRGGLLIAKALGRQKEVQIVGIVDIRPEAPGIEYARTHHIPTSTDYHHFLTEHLDFIIESTGRKEVFLDLADKKEPGVTLIAGDIAKVILNLIFQQGRLTSELRRSRKELEMLLNAAYDGMVAVDRHGRITLFNAAAERMTGVTAKQAIGQPVQEVVPNTRLHHVLIGGKAELLQVQSLGKIEIMTNRVPVLDKDQRPIAAISVFRDVTEVRELNSEVAKLKEMQTLLEAVITSTQDAISVVDASGHGLMINPAYTRLTGLTEKEVLGFPAEVDIAEGESMHMKVLQTKQAFRNVKMKVGSKRREVIVNVAPILVGNELKGSVAVIHDESELRALAQELETVQKRIRKLEAKYTFADIIGQSSAMMAALETARQAAGTGATVLLRGESGSGKELFAHAIHNASERRYNQFIRVNCAAISDSLLESELFGYEEGAFTGARKGGKKGLFEEAMHGTIFLDEIAELSPGTQAKLLRVLQEKEIVRVGGAQSINVDVRVIAATHVNLEWAISERKFREDLYYRLNMLPIVIPPLRYRQEDIEPLVEMFIEKFNHDYRRNVQGITTSAMERLYHYHWPGNVRELENVIGRAMIKLNYLDSLIDAPHIEVYGAALINKEEPVQPISYAKQLSQVLAEAEKSAIVLALKENNGNRTEAARILGISLRSLYYKLDRLRM